MTGCGCLTAPQFAVDLGLEAVRRNTGRSARRAGVLMTAEQNAPGEAHTITIILADDHKIVRDGLRRIVEAEGDMAVIAEALKTPMSSPVFARR